MRKARALNLAWLLWMLITIASLTCAFMIYKWWQRVGFVPIEVVTLTDKLRYAEPKFIKAAVNEQAKRGFFGVSVTKVRDNLLQVPWVSGAFVARKWPNTLVLKISERQPLAVWAGQGVIDTQGKLFFPPSLENLKDLPEFSGDKDQVNAMVDTYLLILAKLKPLGLAVKKLAIMPDHGWRAMLDNGVNIILGQTELEERLNRFVAAFNDKKSGIRNQQVLSVDLRYTNGLAVEYK